MRKQGVCQTSSSVPAMLPSKADRTVSATSSALKLDGTASVARLGLSLA